MHTWKLGQRVLKHADGLPCILAGDFNFQPTSPCYGLLTEGKLDPESDSFSPNAAKKSKRGEAYIGIAEPFSSALKCVAVRRGCCLVPTSFPHTRRAFLP